MSTNYNFPEPLNYQCQSQGNIKPYESKQKSLKSVNEKLDIKESHQYDNMSMGSKSSKLNSSVDDTDQSKKSVMYE